MIILLGEREQNTFISIGDGNPKMCCSQLTKSKKLNEFDGIVIHNEDVGTEIMADIVKIHAHLTEIDSRNSEKAIVLLS